MANRNVSMQFGKSGGVVQNRPGLKFIGSAEITDESTVTLSFEPAGIYVLVTKEWTAATGAFYGHHAFLISVPEADLFGSAAISRTNMAASQNMGITLTNNADSTLSIKQVAATRHWRYALYRVM